MLRHTAVRERYARNADGRVIARGRTRWLVRWSDGSFSAPRRWHCQPSRGQLTVGKRPVPSAIDGTKLQIREYPFCIVVWQGFMMLFSTDCSSRGAQQLGHWLSVRRVIGWAYDKTGKFGGIVKRSWQRSQRGAAVPLHRIPRQWIRSL